MISDSERRRLGEIEMDLRRGDPDLARQFDDWRPGPRQRPILAILVVIALTLAWIVYGPLVGVIALLCATCIGVAAALWRLERAERRGPR